MTKIGVRELMSDDERKLRVCARNSQDARMDDDLVAGCEGIQRGVGFKFDRNSAGFYRGHSVHFIRAVATHQDLDWPLAVVAHKSANPSSRVGAWHRFIVESQKVVAGFDSGRGSRRRVGN